MLTVCGRQHVLPHSSPKWKEKLLLSAAQAYLGAYLLDPSPAAAAPLTEGDAALLLPGCAAYLCWMGGMPSFSSTRSLIRAMVSVGSMSISISLPVSVLTLICTSLGGERCRALEAAV